MNSSNTPGTPGKGWIKSSLKIFTIYPKSRSAFSCKRFTLSVDRLSKSPMKRSSNFLSSAFSRSLGNDSIQNLRILVTRLPSGISCSSCLIDWKHCTLWVGYCLGSLHSLRKKMLHTSAKSASLTFFHEKIFNEVAVIS